MDTGTYTTPVSPFFSFLGTVDIAHGDVSILWRSLILPWKVTALFSAFFITFLASFSSVFLYYIGKYLYGVRAGMRAAVLLLAIPSLILFIPINDVFLPLFPLASFLFFIKGIDKQQSYYYLFLSGFIFSLGLFFSLSLVPLFFIFGIYLLWTPGFRIIRQLVDGIAFSLGVISLPIFLFLLFRYNTFTVAQTLLSGLPESRTYLTWVFFNLLDFFIFLGIPLFAFFCCLLFYLKRVDRLAISFIIMLFLLDLSGVVRGEVARIWIPFYPFLAIILSMFVTKQLKIKRNIFLVILFLQFVQILFMQEFWVMLW